MENPRNFFALSYVNIDARTLRLGYFPGPKESLLPWQNPFVTARGVIKSGKVEL
jgi:hypothetical protein